MAESSGQFADHGRGIGCPVGTGARHTARWKRRRALVLVPLVLAPILANTESARAQDVAQQDPWGVPARPLVAVGEVVGVNLATWAFNYYVRDKPYATVYPGTWWNNIRRGFDYDPNPFFMNVFAHPYHGSVYYNAGRSNALGFWGSVPLTLVGSLMWECCGERHPMAVNDVVHTTLGGIALGEAVYRTSSALLDTEATGAERLGRELGALLLNPIRGFNRTISGRAFAVQPNPRDPHDRVPERFEVAIDAGLRTVSGGSSAGGSAEGAFVNVSLDFGSPFAGRRQKPFDVFELEAAAYGGEATAFGLLAVRGHLITRDLARGARSHHVWALVQSYEYEDTRAYQVGDQSLGLQALSLWTLSPEHSIRTKVGSSILFGSLDSVLEPAGETPAPRAPRVLDYTLGLAGGVEAEGSFGRLSVLVGWRTSWTRSVNHNSRNGAEAVHRLHRGRATGSLRFLRRWSLGADFRLYVRDTRYPDGGFLPVSETVPEIRLFGTWRSGEATSDR